MDLDQLSELYRSQESVQNLFDTLGEEPPEDGRTTVAELCELGELSRTDAIALLKELASLGVGKFTLGRRGHPSRLEWSVDPAELLAALDDYAASTDQALPAATPPSEPPAGPPRSGMATHGFLLRPDLRISLPLPVDLTREEAEALSKWVRLLSFERGPSDPDA